MFKGLRVNRNDNYSTDSYKIEDIYPGLTTYTLYER